MISPATPFPLPELARSLTAVKGVGPATAKALAARGLKTVGDLLYFFPRRYEDRRSVTTVAELLPGETAVVKGEITTLGAWGRGGKMFKLVLRDETGQLACLWFHYKKVHFNGLAQGDEILAVGEPSEARDGGMQMAHPELYPAKALEEDHPSVGRLIPVYPQVEGVRAGSLRRIMADLIRDLAPKIPDYLSGLLPAGVKYLPPGRALLTAHAPQRETPPEDLEAATSAWRKALALEELFHFETALALARAKRLAAPAPVAAPKGDLLRRCLGSLPFELTPGQKQAVKDIRDDLARPRPMARLLAGDVGTGKTAVALAAICLAAEAGLQTVFMAPTEILARQHAETLGKSLAPLGLEVCLVLGSQNGAEREQACRAAGNGAGLLVGTHALFAEGLDFKDLGLCIIDEQHRFGVRQRLKLSAKGDTPHLLVLSATPIPRTLALALSGHLDISDLPQRPGARPPVETGLVAYDGRRQAVEALDKTLAAGEQAYVICPLVEESDKLDLQDAVRTARRLAKYFPKARVGLLHGRLEGPEQQEALEEFKAGGLDILVATTVVEVGVDVPGATLMVILGAERFGLSQLHQLRGRVGRGSKPGRCLVVSGPEPGETGLKRLEAFARTNDGLELAEADLMLRGPGEALGARQSGLPPFRAADWSLDAELIPGIRRTMAELLAGDPGLESPGNAALKKEALRRWGRTLGLAQGD